MAKEQLTRLQQIERIRQKLQQLEAREAASRRKLDSRRKIVLGGMVLAEMRTSEPFKKQIVTMLKERVTRPADKEALAEWLSTDSPQA